MAPPAVYRKGKKEKKKKNNIFWQVEMRFRDDKDEKGPKEKEPARASKGTGNYVVAEQ